jgi:hypothetical protein
MKVGNYVALVLASAGLMIMLLALFIFGQNSNSLNEISVHLLFFLGSVIAAFGIFSLKPTKQ